MKRWITILIFALTPALLFAQGPMQLRGQGPGMGPGPGALMAANPAGAPRMDALKDYLGLTDDQIAGIRTIQKDSREGNKVIAEQLAAKTKTLQETLDAGGAAAVVGQLMLDMKSLRGQLADARKAVLAKVKTVLTAAQLTKLSQLEEAAKLMPAIQAAGALGLIEGPDNPGGGGGGRLMARRPRI